MLSPFLGFCLFILSPILSLKEENATLKTPLISVPNPNKYHIFPDWLEEKYLVL